ncbi:MAG: hypothetical protein AAF791_04520 [Bacteroidota bacterium]
MTRPTLLLLASVLTLTACTDARVPDTRHRGGTVDDATLSLAMDEGYARGAGEREHAGLPPRQAGNVDSVLTAGAEMRRKSMH